MTDTDTNTTHGLNAERSGTGSDGDVVIYLEIDGIAAVAVEVSDVDVWAATIDWLATWLAHAQAATRDDYATFAAEHGRAQATLALQIWVLETMARQMRALADGTPR